METLLVSPNEVLPTLSSCLESGRLFNLEKHFQAGKHLEIDPVDILRTPTGLLLTMDGHHRLTQAMLYKVQIWGNAYCLGDRWPLVDRIIDERVVMVLEAERALAKIAGHKTYQDLYRLSFYPDMFLKS